MFKKEKHNTAKGSNTKSKPSPNKSSVIVGGASTKELIMTSKKKKFAVILFVCGMIALGTVGGYLLYKNKDSNNDSYTTGTTYDNDEYVSYLEETAAEKKPTQSSSTEDKTNYYVIKVDSLSFAGKDKELAELYINEIKPANIVLPLDQAEATVRAMQATAKTKEAAPLIDHIITMLQSSTSSDESAKAIIKQRLDHYISLKETL